MLWSDLKFAVRGLIGAPALSVAAVVALALGIGPNTAIFSIVYATLLAPLPFSEPDQLVRVSPMVVGDSQSRTSPADYLEWKERATSFQSLEAFWPGRALNLATANAPERVVARQVTPGGHRIFGEGVWLGRDFQADEDQPGKQYVVLLSHRLWRERFGADPDIIGRDIRMDSIPYTVVRCICTGKLGSYAGQCLDSNLVGAERGRQSSLPSPDRRRPPEARGDHRTGAARDGHHRG